MKWNKAVAQIEEALQKGLSVEVRFHRKWARNDNEKDLWSQVDNVSTYDWHGAICKAVNCNFWQLNEGSYIIDEINAWEE